MEKVKSEKEMQKYIIENFDKYFKSKYLQSNVTLKNGKLVNIISEDDWNVYLINVYKNPADSKAVWNMFDLVHVYKTFHLNDDKKVHGVIATSEITDDALSTSRTLAYVKLRKIDDIDLENSKSKFTTTLSNTTIKQLNDLKAIYSKENLNEVIADLVKEDWTKKYQEDSK